MLSGLSACSGDDSETGGDDEVGADGETAASTTDEYCALMVEGEDRDDEAARRGEGLEPDVVLEFWGELVEAAPGEIRGDMQLVYDQFSEAKDGDDVASFWAALESDPQLSAALERLEAFSVEECGLEYGDEDNRDHHRYPSTDEPLPDDAELEAPMPDDVTLTREEATFVTWDRVDDAWDYRLEVDGRTVDTYSSERAVVVGELDGEFKVEALEFGESSLGPAPGVQLDAGESLVVSWTEESGVHYYVEYESPGESGSQLAASPFLIEAQADEVEFVRFSPGLAASDEDGTAHFDPFVYGYEDVLELPLP